MQNGCETLRVSAIRGSGYIRSEKLKHSPFLSRCEHPGGSARQPDAMVAAGCKWRRTSGVQMAAAGVQLLSGYVVRTPSDGVLGRPIRVYSLHGFQRTLLNLGLLW